MLTIRLQTYCVFQPVQQARFYDHTIELLETHFQDECQVPESEHRERIQHLAGKEEEDGLTTERQVAGSIVLADVGGQDFDEELESRRILEDSNT